MKTTDDVLVVGAGPVGLMMAIELLRQGARVRLVDRRMTRSIHSKALAVFPRTIEELHLLGLAEAFLAIGARLHRFVAHARGEIVARIDFEELATPYPFALSIPQSETERLLEEHLRTLGGRVERGLTFVGLEQSADAVSAQLRDANGVAETVVVPWLVACDGAHSDVRRAVGARFEGSTYEETFLLADIRATGGDLPGDELHFFLADDGVLGFAPYAPGLGRVFASSPTSAGSTDAPPPDRAEIQTLITRRTATDWNVTTIEWASRFHLSRRKVEQLRHGRVFLAGDAAHIHSPAGGQGMNLGLQDAANLGWKLALVAHDRAPEALLDSYHAERNPIATAVVRATDAVTRVSLLHNHTAQTVRNALLPIVSGLTRRKVAEAMSELAIDYHDSPIVESHHGVPLHAGVRAPDGRLREASTGRLVALFDLLQTPRHTLLIFEDAAGVERERCHGLARGIAEVFSDVITARHILSAAAPRISAAESTDVFIDPEGTLRVQYTSIRGGLVLVRPDGYVGFCSEGPEGDALWTYLDRLLHRTPAPTLSH